MAKTRQRRHRQCQFDRRTCRHAVQRRLFRLEVALEAMSESLHRGDSRSVAPHRAKRFDTGFRDNIVRPADWEARPTTSVSRHSVTPSMHSTPMKAPSRTSDRGRCDASRDRLDHPAANCGADAELIAGVKG